MKASGPAVLAAIAGTYFACVTYQTEFSESMFPNAHHHTDEFRRSTRLVGHRESIGRNLGEGSVRIVEQLQSLVASVDHGRDDLQVVYTIDVARARELELQTPGGHNSGNTESNYGQTVKDVHIIQRWEEDFVVNYAYCFLRSLYM